MRLLLRSGSRDVVMVTRSCIRCLKLPGHVFPLPKDKKALSSFLTGHAQVKIHEKGMDNECSPLLLAR